MFGRSSIWFRLRLGIGLTTVIPLIVAVALAKSMVDHTAGRFFVPEIGAHLDRALGLYQELARAMKDSMRHQTSVLAAHEPLRRAVATGQRDAVERELTALFADTPGLVSLSVMDGDEAPLASIHRGRTLDRERENSLTVTRPLAPPAPAASALPAPAAEAAGAPRARALSPRAEEDPEAELEGPHLVAVFATDRARFDERDAMSSFLDTYRLLEQRRSSDESTYVFVFALLLCLTAGVAVGVGGMMARGVAVHVRRLDAATRRVASGDLSVRVPVMGTDELAGLAQAFNRMLDEVETSRARIEFLQRVAAWQEMARHLAHEIKNPLTPIQLAVQEVHRRYAGDDPSYRSLLRETLEMVEAEVRTLHRLVAEFSDFARLPHPALVEGDLAAFLREQQERLQWATTTTDETQSTTALTVQVVAPKTPLRAAFDGQMLSRALLNLVLNARQAIEAAGRSRGQITLTLTRDGEYLWLEVEDDGPGIPAELRDTVFDPYVTTKTTGTGLGLAIVKKIVVEHGGSIQATAGRSGGARVRLRLPVAGTAAARAAAELEPCPPSRPYHARPSRPES